MKKHEEDKQHISMERWLLTYSDLITLLMIFFVVMYALSNIDAQKFKAIADSLNQAIAGGNRDIIEAESSGDSIINGKVLLMQQVGDELQQYIEANGLENQISLINEERGLVIRFRDTILFDNASATLTPEARQIILKVAKILAKLPNYIVIEGHTNDLPINTREFPSNWELSAARAVNVLRVLVEDRGINPQKVSATGYGEYRPFVKNDTEEHRAQNRRVDIVILKPEYSNNQPLAN